MSQNNRVVLTGNLGRDVKIIGKDEKLFAAFQLATTDSYKSGEEYKQKKAQWHRIIIFNAGAIEQAKTFKKGDRVEVNGSISYRPFEVHEGGKKPVIKQEATIIAWAIEAKPL